MTLVKAHAAARHMGGAISYDLADFKAEAARILAAAKAEADRLVREARSDSQRIRTEAADKGRIEGMASSREEGFALGKSEGEALGRREAQGAYAERLALLTEHWAESLSLWEVSRDALMREARKGVLQLSLGIASRVVQRMIRADPDIALGQLEMALELLGKATAVTVSCSVEDRDLLQANLPVVLERLGATLDVTFVADESISRGGVVVRVAEGGVDATIETQMDRIAEALLPAAPGGHQDPSRGHA
jgi:flagellar assembly protein FliH